MEVFPELNNWFEGGCHCGEVRFKIWLDSFDALECNCSICLKKGFVNLITEPAKFALLQGEESLTQYQFNTKVAKHQFCKHCGIHTFSRPRSHPDAYDVNARCLDVSLSVFSIEPFDGQNWEENVHSIQ